MIHAGRPAQATAFAIALLLTAAFAGAPASARSEEGPGRGGIPRPLVVAASNNFPPINFLDRRGQLSGFGRDISAAVARAVGRDVAYRHTPRFREALEWVASGEADLIHNAAYSADRDREFDFTEPIITMREVIFVRTDQYNIAGFASLSGKTVACVNQHISHQYLSGFPAIRCEIAESAAEALYRLVNGDVDAFVYPEQIVVSLAQELRLADKIKITGEPLRVLQWGMAVREGNAETLALLGEGLRRIRATGEYERIYDKWFGARPFAGYTRKEAAAIVAAAIVLSLLAGGLLSLLAANRKLRRARNDLSRSVAELTRAEESLAAALRELENIMTTLPDVLLTVDADGHLIKWNRSLETATGRPREEIAGHSLPSLAAEEDRPALVAALRACAERGEAEWDGRLLGPEDRRIPYHWKGALRRDETAATVITVTGRDVTERRKAEEEREKLASVIENSRDFIGISAPDGQVVYINRAGRELVGIEGTEGIRGTRVPDYAPARHVARIAEILEIVRESGRWEGEARLRHFRSGSGIPVALSIFAIRDPRTGETVGLATVGRDITEKKRMEDEILKARKLESLGILAGGIAHDFNNLLTSILGNIALAKPGPGGPDEAAARLREAEKASLRARDLTQQLLTFSRGGAPVRTTASIGGLIRESAAFAVRGSAARCELDIPADLRCAEVDEGQFTQVIHNLVINAAQAMPGGGTVRIACENVRLAPGEVPPLAPGEYVRISVSDSGVGIPREHLSKVFDPYFTTKAGGSGLGLATSYSIVRKHDGQITVASAPGTGSTFRILLPAAAGGAPSAPPDEDGPVAGRGRILVMDDEEMVRDVTGSMLESLGYAVVMSREGEEAVALYREGRESGKPFDAVIMDLTIPGGVGGRDAVRLLREIDPDVRALVSSGYSNDPVMAEYSRHGFAGVIPKPYTPQQLGEALRRVLDPRGPGPRRDGRG